MKRSRSPVPHGATVLELVSQPKLEWPWPYSSDEIAGIAAMLDEEEPGPRANAVLLMARYYCVVEESKEDDRQASGRTHQNPDKEIASILETMRELDRKVRDLTHETIAHIGPEIYYALMEYAFRGHNGLFLSLSHVPAYGGAKNGRSGEDNRKWLMSNLRCAYKDAKGKSAHGHPAFQRACLEPLGISMSDSTLKDAIKEAEKVWQTGIQ